MPVNSCMQNRLDIQNEGEECVLTVYLFNVLINSSERGNLQIFPIFCRSTIYKHKLCELE